jgi:tartrate dehydratase beta subunit/fumarate hydratase class I family protein
VSPLQFTAVDAATSETPLRATFQVKLNGKVVSIGTVGQAYTFITNISSVEWMEFRSLHDEAIAQLEAAAENAIMTVQATNALRALFVRAKVL